MAVKKQVYLISVLINTDELEDFESEIDVINIDGLLSYESKLITEEEFTANIKEGDVHWK